MALPLLAKKTIEIFGISINQIAMQQLLDIIDSAITHKEHIQIGVVNAAKIVNMRKNSGLRQDVVDSDMILADGYSVVWASKILGKALPERVAGIDLMYRLLEIGNIKKYRVYCLGATEEVSARVEQKIKKNYPNVIIAGRRNGYYSSDEEPVIAAEIAKSQADILFVAITSPKKENFMAKWGDTINAPIVHGVGGSFDIVAGKVNRAPLRWQNFGLEWLYRVIQEPRRLWKRYLITNIIFIFLVIKEIFIFVRKKLSNR